MGLTLGNGNPVYAWVDPTSPRSAFVDDNGLALVPEIYRPEAFMRTFAIPQDKVNYVPGDLVIVNGNSAVIYAHKPNVRGRGNTTWGAPKKPFKVRSLDRKQRPFNYAPSRDWAFMADAHDASYLRTAVAFELARRATGRWAPYSHHIWLDWKTSTGDTMNGLYRYSETVDLQVGRQDYRAMKDEDVSGNAVTGPYMMEVDILFDDAGFRSALDQPVMYDAPDVVGIVEQEQYIKEWYDRFEDAMVDGREWEMLSLMDVQSWADWYLLQEFCKNVDSRWFKSIKFVKDQDSPGGSGRFVLWAPWDFDRTLGTGSSPTDGWITRQGPNAGGQAGLYPSMIHYAWEKSPVFREECRRTWIENYLPEIPGVIDHMYELRAEIEPWIAPDRALWYSGTPQPAEHHPDALAAWMTARADWITLNL